MKRERAAISRDWRHEHSGHLNDGDCHATYDMNAERNEKNMQEGNPVAKTAEKAVLGIAKRSSSSEILGASCRFLCCVREPGGLALLSHPLPPTHPGLITPSSLCRLAVC